MARQRVKQNSQKPKQNWGVNNVYTVTVQGANGPYKQYRLRYRTCVPVFDQGVLIDWDENALRTASLSESPADVIAKAERLAQEGRSACDAWWKIKNGASASPSEDIEESKDMPIRMTLMDCARESMSGRVRYENKALVGHRPSYEKKQQNYLKHVEDSGLSDRPMDTLRLAEIKKWFIEYMGSHAETTSARFKSWLLGVGAWGQANGYWKANVFSQLPVVIATVSDESKRIYSTEEIDAMWEAAQTPQERAMLVMLRCGLRQGEVLGVHAGAIHSRNIVVEYSLGEHGNVWGDQGPKGDVTKNVKFLGPPKTKGSAARVFVPEPWLEIIKQAASCAAPCRIRAYDDPKGENAPYVVRRFIVSNRFGLCWDEGCASLAMRKLMKRAGVECRDNDSTFHVWRHTFCSDLVALGADDITIALLMRHRDANFSKSVYAAARETDIKTYKCYAAQIDSSTDYMNAIMLMDEDRRRAKRKSRLRIA